MAMVPPLIRAARLLYHSISITYYVTEAQPSHSVWSHLAQVLDPLVVVGQDGAVDAGHTAAHVAEGHAGATAHGTVTDCAAAAFAAHGAGKYRGC